MTTAVRYTRFGGPEVLTLDEIPTPEPGKGQVRLQVRAAAINPVDGKIRRGQFTPDSPPTEPVGAGLEFAGLIDAVGSEVEGWRPGQAVFGKTGRAGTIATHVLINAEDLLLKPEWLSFEEAAALPVASETSVRAFRLLGVKAGHTVLIHAVAGAVGLVAAQLAIAWGAKVVGTASEARHEFLRELGVVPVTYGEGWVDRVRAAAPQGIDRVLDASGRDVLGGSVELVGSPDNVVTIADGRAPEHGVRFTGGGTDSVPVSEVFAEVLPLAERGAVKLPVARTFPLDQVADAYRLSDDGHLLGKIVITVG